MAPEGMTDFHGKSVLVTGHTGFKGSWLALWLHRLGAQVTGEGRLERCVVWPGARAVAPLVDAVIAPEGTAQCP